MKSPPSSHQAWQHLGRECHLPSGYSGSLSPGTPLCGRSLWSGCPGEEKLAQSPFSTPGWGDTRGHVPVPAPQQRKACAPQTLAAADPLLSSCWCIPHNFGSLNGDLMAKKTFSKSPSLFSSVPPFPSLMAITEPFSKAGFGGILAPLV